MLKAERRHTGGASKTGNTARSADWSVFADLLRKPPLRLAATNPYVSNAKDVRDFIQAAAKRGGIDIWSTMLASPWSNRSRMSEEEWDACIDTNRKRFCAANTPFPGDARRGGSTVNI
jgi:hypothetical protein